MESAKKTLFVGITGTGKSSLANLLVGKNVFPVGHGLSSQTAGFQVEESPTGMKIYDTQGLCDTRDTPDKTREKIIEALEASNGVDIILFCIRADERLKEQEYIAFKFMVEAIFGESCKANLLLVITHANDLEKDENEWLCEEAKKSPMFNYIWKACGHRVVFVDNPRKKTEKATKRRELTKSRVLQAIHTINAPKFTPDIARKAREEHEARLKELHEAQLKAKSEEEKRLVLEKVAEENRNWLLILKDAFLDRLKPIEKNPRGFFEELGNLADAAFTPLLKFLFG